MDYEELVTGGWAKSRRCEYIYYSDRIYFNVWEYLICNQDVPGEGMSVRGVATEQRCNCPQTYGPYDSNSVTHDMCYTAVCQFRRWVSAGAASVHNDYNNTDSGIWVRDHTCPKGWGPHFINSNEGTKDHVHCGWGYVSTPGTYPIYGYVTRYKTVYYDYIGSRVAKS